jgi:rhodanese-related sulfurtransferase
MIIDVRTQAEFQEGNTPGSVNIPLDELELRLSEIPAEEEIVLVCRSGGRAAMAEQILKSHGFTNVVNKGSWQNI